jgi:hypothetical protein
VAADPPIACGDPVQRDVASMQLPAVGTARLFK